MTNSLTENLETPDTLASSTTVAVGEEYAAPDHGLATLAGLFKASGDPLRLEILRVLQRDTFGVLELCSLFDIRQPAMSHHLKVLAKAGLVDTQREGNSIFYRRVLAHSSSPQDGAIRALFGCIDAVDLPKSLLQRMEEIREQRAELSRVFFARNASQFRQQQELIATYDYYSEPALDMLLSSEVGADATVLEIGPGEGAFLGELAPRFNKVIALDNSADLLEKARVSAAEAGWNNIEFILGDTGDAVKQGLQVKGIVMNMVLHHVPAPAALFEDCFALLDKDGTLIVTDLCHHDQEWVKENCGDLWLGFNPEDLSIWAENAGFCEGNSLYIGLRNGFQVQIRQFCKEQTAH